MLTRVIKTTEGKNSISHIRNITRKVKKARLSRVGVPGRVYLDLVEGWRSAAIYR